MTDDDHTSEGVTTQGRVTGLIVPPPDIRAVVDKTAQFVAKNGRSFERKIAGETASAKFSFLRAADPYHAYYESKVSAFTDEAERAAVAAAAPAPATDEQDSSVSTTSTADAAANEAAAAEAAEAAAKASEDGGAVVIEKKAVEAVTASVVRKIKETPELAPPPAEQFTIHHPVLSALDQEILYLTAQYTALSGTAFLEGLATREQRNPQFDFLKPTHAHFAYFTALVESYAKVLARTDEQMARIEDGVDRMKVLDRCVHRLEFDRTEQERKALEAAASDAERLALSQIDWHDFVVVERITLDDADEEAAAAAAAAAAADADAKGSDDDMDMDDDDSDAEGGSKPAITVVEDYVPLATAPTTAPTAQLLTVDGKAVASADANEHMRILLMNPKWREETQRHLEKQKESSFAAGTAIADSLRRFATKRADIFASSADEEARLEQATAAPVQQQTQQVPVQDSVDVDMMDDDDDDDDDDERPTTAASVSTTRSAAPTSAPGAPGQAPLPPRPGFAPFGYPPGVAPGMLPPGVAPGPPGVGFAPGIGMRPPGMMGPPGVRPPGSMMGPPGVVGGPPGLTGPLGVPAGPPGVPPPSFAVPGVPPPLPAAGVPPTAAGVSASQPTEDTEPAAKRQRTDAALLPETEFAVLHPGNVRLVIAVPNEPEHAQWQLAGQTLSVEVDILSSVRTVKEKVMAALAGMPVNKQQLKSSLGFLKDTLSCAHYNFVDGTALELSVRQRGGRR